MKTAVRETASCAMWNLQVAQGELVILAGRSGCGKTTLTRVLNGLCPQFYPGELTGSYLLDGQDALKMPVHQLGTMVGSVFQTPEASFLPQIPQMRSFLVWRIFPWSDL